MERELSSGRFEFAEGDEDIHMAIERRVTELAGDAGGRLHTARSRNDQVATDMAMFTRAHAAEAAQGAATLAWSLLELAERHLDWEMPGYTHLQRAQPVFLAHHLLAYVWMLLRDRERFGAVARATSVLPLGAGALAGVNFETDRELVARELGFASVAENSIDAVSNRDFVLDYLAAAATCATHLSRLGAEIVLWSSEEFGFCEVADAWASGSSIMPQKKNPDAAELLRAKAPRIAGHHAALQGTFHALPLTYNKDMQEDKEHLFDAVDTLELCLAAANGMLGSITFDRERMAAAAADEFPAATDIADLLVRRGLPFRQAHGIVASLVRQAVGTGRTLSELSADEVRAALATARRGVLRGARRRRVARIQGLPRRDQRRPGPRAAGARPRGAGVSAGPGVQQPPDMARLLRSFYDRPVLEVARDLIGCELQHGGCAGVIVETEAYHHTEPACHAYVGLTARTSTLFGPPGIAYVYRSYGIHALLNAVCEAEDVGAAVLIRAVEPLAGIALMRARRGVEPLRALCSGPGKLTQAFGIGLELNGSDLVAARAITIVRRGCRGESDDRRRPADRDHQGGRAAVAVLCRRQPVRLAAGRAALTSPSAAWRGRSSAPADPGPPGAAAPAAAGPHLRPPPPVVPPPPPPPPPRRRGCAAAAPRRRHHPCCRPPRRPRWWRRHRNCPWRRRRRTAAAAGTDGRQSPIRCCRSRCSRTRSCPNRCRSR